MKKKFICITIMLALSMQLVACGTSKRGLASEVLLSSNVTNDGDLEETQYEKIEVQKINLNLKDGEYFSPVFYQNGEFYGTVNRGVGRLSGYESTDEYAVRGWIKDKLYKLDKKNEFKTTEKKVLGLVNYSTYKGVDENNIKKFYTIDYKKENLPSNSIKLENKLNELKLNDYYMHIINDQFIHLNRYHRELIWDLEANEVYEFKCDENEHIVFYYVDYLKKLIAITNNGKISKVNIENNQIKFEEYFNIEVNKEISSLSGILLNDHQILLNSSEFVSKENESIYRCKDIYVFDFKTNEIKNILKCDEETMLTVSPVRGVKKNLIMLEEYEKASVGIKPKFRYLAEVINDKLNILYKDDIRDEGESLYLRSKAVSSDDGKEIFVENNTTELKNNDTTSKKSIYKKYIFK